MIDGTIHRAPCPSKGITLLEPSTCMPTTDSLPKGQLTHKSFYLAHIELVKLEGSIITTLMLSWGG